MKKFNALFNALFFAGAMLGLVADLILIGTAYSLIIIISDETVVFPGLCLIWTVQYFYILVPLAIISGFWLKRQGNKWLGWFSGDQSPKSPIGRDIADQGWIHRRAHH